MSQTDESAVEESQNSSIQEHLDRAGERYLNSINDTRPESTVSMMERLSPLVQFVQDEATIVSVGIGQGEEICGLYELFGDSVNIIGLDISEIAIETTRARIKRNQFRAEVINANATDLPFADGSVDAIIFSSILHEIYSYHENGFDAFVKALQEVSRVLKRGGVIFIRDFAAPESDHNVTLKIRTPLAMKFYEWFRISFRKLPLWGPEMETVRMKNDFLPPIGNGSVYIPFSSAAELLLHFRSFWSDYQSGLSQMDDPNWKESDEAYLISSGSSILAPDQYLEMVSDSLGIQFEIVFKKLSEREKTNSFLSRHFMLSDQSNVDLIPSVTRKVECVFQKSGDVKKHYAAAVVFDENENVLLCKRAAYKKIAPNMWHLPGGAIEEGENPIEAITRELKEELDLDTVTVIPTKTTLTYPIEGGFMQTHCFYVDVSNDPTILNEENSEFQFVKPDAVSEYIEEHLLDDNMKAIRAAFKAAQSQ